MTTKLLFLYVQLIKVTKQYLVEVVSILSKKVFQVWVRAQKIRSGLVGFSSISPTRLVKIKVNVEPCYSNLSSIIVVLMYTLIRQLILNFSALGILYLHKTNEVVIMTERVKQSLLTYLLMFEC